jgi:hypothetical protein
MAHWVKKSPHWFLKLMRAGVHGPFERWIAICGRCGSVAVITECEVLSCDEQSCSRRWKYFVHRQIDALPEEILKQSADGLLEVIERRKVAAG